jgi:ketosteroid isomerase-like protein
MRKFAAKCALFSLLMLVPAFAGPSNGPSGGETLEERIFAQERAELDTLKSGDLSAFANFIADEAVFVDALGPAGKAEIVQHTAEFRLHDYTMAGLKFVPLSPDSGLIVYLLTMTGTAHGKEFAAKVYVSALWRRRGGAWTCVFSQETAAK